MQQILTDAEQVNTVQIACFKGNKFADQNNVFCGPMFTKNFVNSKVKIKSAITCYITGEALLITDPPPASSTTLTLTLGGTGI